MSYGGAYTSVGQNFIEVGEKYGTTRESTEDPNGLREENINKYGVGFRFI